MNKWIYILTAALVPQFFSSCGSQPTKTPQWMYGDVSAAIDRGMVHAVEVQSTFKKTVASGVGDQDPVFGHVSGKVSSLQDPVLEDLRFFKKSDIGASPLKASYIHLTDSSQKTVTHTYLRKAKVNHPVERLVIQFMKSDTAWKSGFLMVFFATFPMVIFGVQGGITTLITYAIGFPILKFIIGKSAWGKKISEKMKNNSGGQSGGGWSSGSGWSSGGGGWSSGGGGGFSGGGGSFGGGGYSGGGFGGGGGGSW